MQCMSNEDIHKTTNTKKQTNEKNVEVYGHTVFQDLLSILVAS